MQTISYYLSLALLMTHEIDAIRATEWKLLYVLRTLNDDSAYFWFVVLHVPLFFFMLWLSQHRNQRIQQVTRLVVAGFCVVHGLLHFLLSSEAEYGFEGLLSNSLIFGSSAVAACFIGMLAFQWRSGQIR